MLMRFLVPCKHTPKFYWPAVQTRPSLRFPCQLAEKSNAGFLYFNIGLMVISSIAIDQILSITSTFTSS
jgi:hypothetical protein